jgi:hypothetical protein
MLIDDKPKKKRVTVPNQRPKLNILHKTDAARSTFHKYLGFTIEVIPLGPNKDGTVDKKKGFTHAVIYGAQVFHNEDNIHASIEETVTFAKAAIDMHKDWMKEQTRKVGVFSWQGNRRLRRAKAKGVL